MEGWGGLQVSPGVSCLEPGWEVRLDGGQKDPVVGTSCRLRVGPVGGRAAAPDLTSAHAHSCGVVPKADAAPC